MRRHSDSEKKGSSRRGRIPIPVSVSLRNLYPISKEKQIQNKGKKFFRPDHAMSLLHLVRLEILIAPSGGNKSDETDEVSETTDLEEKVIFSSLAPVRTVNPSWNHLDECIEDYLAIDGYLDSETGAYRFMRLRIWLLAEDDGGDATGNFENNESSLQPLLDISIHPTKLRHLAKIPPKLPVNSLIFHFSDGSIRATTTLLDIVGDQDGSHADEHNKDEFGRFGDDVFRTLDQVTPVKQPSRSILEGKETAGDPDLLTTSLSDDSQDVGSSTSLSMGGTNSEKKQQQELILTTQTKFAGGELDAASQDVSTERQHLEMLIRLEEDALENEILSLEEDKAETHALLEKVGQVETILTTHKEGILTEKQLCRRSEFFLEARRIKLLLDLRNIYPISFLLGEDRYSIRDLRIPLDIHSGVVPEEELSAAFGFLCHLVSMVGKYMSVQLRHRIFCNSSRSAIQEDGGVIYPIFQARVVERDQLDHGVLLLRRNVECILKTRDIEYKNREHLLVTVQRFFDTVIDRGG